MAQIVLQRINDGDTGAMSAQKIYSNDSKLLAAIRGIEDLLDAYGSLITIDTGMGTQVTLVQESGSGTTSVMSQRAVTEYVNNNVESMCVIGQEINGGVEMPEADDYVNVWVSRASANAQGNSLTTLWNDVQQLKGVYETISEMQETINSLTDRVANLERQLAN
jgi:hypothetical protein